MAALGLRCCTWAFSSCGERGATLHWGSWATFCCRAWASHCGGFSCSGARALGARASVVVARRLSSCGSRALELRLSSCGSRALEHRLSSCGARAQLFRSMWDLPGPGLKPMSPVLAGGFLTTVPPGKSLMYSFNCQIHFKNCKFRASLVVQWLRICLPGQGTRVRALVREDPTCHGATEPVRHNY